MPQSVDEFLSCLNKISMYEGVPYGRVNLILEQQAAYGNAVASQLSGYLALSDAFKAFYLESIEKLNKECQPRVTKPLSEHYALFVARLNNNVQSLMGAERLALNGYPLQAYTIHRNTFDNIVLTAAVLLKHINFYDIEGIDPDKPLDLNAVKQKRKTTEWKVLDLMLGKHSNLSEQTIYEMRKIGDAFDLEVHGSRFSLAGVTGWVKGEESLSIVPKFQETDFALHLNRYVELAWMVHRLLPAIQPPEAPIEGDWPEKWAILDQSFEYLMTSLTEECGKKFGVAIVEFVKTKLPFSAGSVFPL